MDPARETMVVWAGLQFYRLGGDIVMKGFTRKTNLVTFGILVKSMLVGSGRIAIVRSHQGRTLN